LDPTSRPIFGGEGWNMIYNRPALPMRTVAGRCGASDQMVTTQSLDAALPKILETFFGDELEGVLLVSQRERWPADNAAVEFARNDFDAARSGDAILIPRPGVLMHFDPGRGSGHGSHYEYDIHVPLIFWGYPFKAARSDAPTAPYDLAPTLARTIGLALPDAIGRDVLRR
jgi:hypothetical protein